jgi:hypothetical protein
VEQNIELMRALLNDLVSKSNGVLYEGKVLEVSKQLDQLIAAYYETSSR